MRLEDIKCPHCEAIQDDMWEVENIVTYHAEDGAIEYECQHCDKTFWIEENVIRYYDVSVDDPNPIKKSS